MSGRARCAVPFCRRTAAEAAGSRDGFLAYRKDHLAELVDYIRSDLVVFPGREN